MARTSRLQARQEIASKKHTVVREEILNSAVRLFAERGYRAVSMDDVAAGLQYTKSVIYYYFKSKNEILWQIFTRNFERFSGDIEALAAVEEPVVQKFTKMVKVHALNVMNNMDSTAVYNHESAELTPAQRQRLNGMHRNYDMLFESVYQRGVAEGVFRNMPVHIAVGGCLGMCNWLHAWFNEKGPLSAPQIADLFTGILENGYIETSPAL
jgi:TetR/AcrR family transcriptional regulator, cholesterol catabolism regulator